MKPHGKIGIGLVVAALAAGACGSPPPPEVPPPKPAPTPKPEPPPPPPACESLDEECRAAGDTSVTIGPSQVVFRPPSGWVYAKTARGTLAQVGDGGPVLVLTVFTPESDKAALGKQREATLAALAELAGIELPNKAVGFDKPEQTEDVSKITMQYWQREQAKRGAAAGSLLVLMAAVDDRVLLGLGYVPDDDSSGADKAIFEALQSIERRSGEEEEAGTTTEEKDNGP